MSSMRSKRKSVLSVLARWTLNVPSRTSSPKVVRSGPFQFRSKDWTSCRSRASVLLWNIPNISPWEKPLPTCNLMECSCFLFMSLMYQATPVMVQMASWTTSKPSSSWGSKCFAISCRITPITSNPRFAHLQNNLAQFWARFSLEVAGGTSGSSVLVSARRNRGAVSTLAEPDVLWRT